MKGYSEGVQSTYRQLDSRPEWDVAPVPIADARVVEFNLRSLARPHG